MSYFCLTREELEEKSGGVYHTLPHAKKRQVSQVKLNVIKLTTIWPYIQYVSWTERGDDGERETRSVLPGLTVWSLCS